MGNPFVHIELASTDVAASKQFYESMFDWQLQDVDMGGGMIYTLVQVGGGTGGGMWQIPAPGMPSAWLSYVAVDDIHAATEKARGLGAQVTREATEVPNTGWLSIITDPTGAALGLWQQKV